MRKTKIVCTIGPSSQEEETLRKLILAGMNVARFNFSHGDHQEHGRKLERVRKLGRELHCPVAVLLDTRGPEIRLGDFAEGRVQLMAGQRFVLTAREVAGSAEMVSITYQELVHDVVPGDEILIDDGLIGMRVEEVTGTDIVCVVVNSGPVSNRKGVNVPGVKLSMPFINEKDREDILFAIEQGFDFIAASFVRSKADILELRELLRAHNSRIQIIAKIESLQGIENMEEILEAADGIMVARGDMGVEIPLEEVPIVQKQLIRKAVCAGKHVITATQMLDSMIKNPRPTRAEVTDVANAIYDGTTAIMLSGETANGAYPVEALETMARIAERAEQSMDTWAGRTKRGFLMQVGDVTSAICHGTCSIAAELHAAAIITVTMTGFTSAMIARYKPGCPIISCTTSRLVWRQMNLQWGVTPFLIPQENTTEDLFREAAAAAVAAGLVKKGDIVVLTAGLPLGKAGTTNMLRVVEV